MRELTSTYPAAERGPVVDDLHGRRVADPYRWLEDAADPRTRRWQSAQDEYWRKYAASLPARRRFHDRVAELTAVGLVTPPTWRGDRQLFLRRTARQDHPVLVLADPDGTERVLVDPLSLDPSGRTTLDSWHASPSGELLAFQLSRGGDEQAALYVMEVATGRLVDRPIDRCRYSPVAWLPDGQGFYFVGNRQVRLHRVGDPDDVVLLESPASYGLELSTDGRWLTIAAARGAANDLWLADLSRSAPEKPVLTVVQEGVDAGSVLTIGRDGWLYVVTTLGGGGAKICVGEPERPRPEHWRNLVPADPEAPLSDLAFLDGPELDRPLLLVGRSRQSIGEVAVHDLRTGEHLRDVPLPGLGSIGSLTTRPEGGHEVWFTYTDSITPAAVHRYDARTGETTFWAGPPGAAVLPEVETRPLTYRSADGTPVQLVILAKPSDGGPRPTTLYGYGGFGQSLTPSYSAFTLAWVEAGGVFATANVRGGGEQGDEWHRAGMLERKQNSFDDFIAAAETLIAEGWTTPDQLGSCGESNGGLLVGASLTQRPDLFAAAVCSAPLLDMVRYEGSGLGPSWVSEYGSAADPDQLACLLAYSPYHRVLQGERYPAVLFTVFGGDTRVDPLHARKMCAALQHATVDDRPVLLRYERDVGHGEAAVSRGVALAADMLTFLADRTGLAP